MSKTIAPDCEILKLDIHPGTYPARTGHHRTSSPARRMRVRALEARRDSLDAMFRALDDRAESPTMTEYRELLKQLEDEQRKIPATAAKSVVLPSDKTLAKISDIEVTIGALTALIEDGSTER